MRSFGHFLRISFVMMPKSTLYTSCIIRCYRYYTLYIFVYLFTTSVFYYAYYYSWLDFLSPSISDFILYLYSDHSDAKCTEKNQNNFEIHCNKKKKREYSLFTAVSCCFDGNHCSIFLLPCKRNCRMWVS